jgi:hypothetical protein
MLNKPSQNPIGYSKNPENSKLLNLIDYSITSFCSALGFNKGFFSKFLPYSETQYPKYINPNEDSHNLKITDLETILINLDSFHSKLILDYLCNLKDCICVQNEDKTDNKFSSLENLLLHITATNGNLANSFLTALKDGNINQDEKEQLKTIAYQLREFLITFENRILETK